MSYLFYLSVCKAAVLWAAASSIYSKQRAASLLLKSMWCNHTVVLTWLMLERIPVLFYQRSDMHMINDLSITVCTFPIYMLTLPSVDEILLLSYVNWSTHHHHHVVPLARISLTLSHHFSLLFIASGRSSGLHPVSSHSCRVYVRAGHPAFARAYVGVHRSTSLMSSSLLFQQCPACLVRLTWIVFVMGGGWSYSWCFVGCCHQDLFNIPLNILV